MDDGQNKGVPASPSSQQPSASAASASAPASSQSAVPNATVWASSAFAENHKGAGWLVTRISFVSLEDALGKAILAAEKDDYSVLAHHSAWVGIPASATGARSGETNADSARSEGRQSGGEAATPDPSSQDTDNG